ncbi:hypothetical protein WR25_11921 isoform D [Diploscapter pachys]|uniref:Galectin n=1 Tax=Diploscapter pachys TaxID=2018661 RepID=A0A2A2LT55_9BILA|nr:hypothetical protein WR25_11921 isoform A [Diploscapter pachys]PAV89373.1 hypothetical protein WR25_11921 isoform B [Diploscapter pachys]PAV89374.1 hypothetical protein WR25_11921 isoform C [Diploscapter pachys]PAV89375.1 hypothetical protein WR25_11921 isoform D [Diploscapter pachys]
MHTVYSPPIPGTVAIHEQLHDGCKIRVIGNVTNGHHKNFAIELLSGPHVVLHVNFRFHHEHQVVMNSSSFGNWGPEVRHKNPLHHGNSFDLLIAVHAGHYHISVNGHHLADYHHRFPAASVQAIGLRGDMGVSQVIFEGFRFHQDWNRTHDFGHGGYHAYGTDQYQAPQFQQGHTYNAYWN